MVHVVHFADVHLGVENYGSFDPSIGYSTRVTDFLTAMDKMVEYALKYADLVLFAGDAYKTRDPSPTQQREFAARIVKISSAGIPVVLLAGNHDTPSTVGRANTIDVFDVLNAANVIVISKAKVLKLRTKAGQVRIIALPWSDLSRAGKLLRKEYDHFIPNIVMSHCTISGASYGSERKALLGTEQALAMSLFDSEQFDRSEERRVGKEFIYRWWPVD